METYKQQYHGASNPAAEDEYEEIEYEEEIIESDDDEVEIVEEYVEDDETSYYEEEEYIEEEIISDEEDDTQHQYSSQGLQHVAVPSSSDPAAAAAAAVGTTAAVTAAAASSSQQSRAIEGTPAVATRDFNAAPSSAADKEVKSKGGGGSLPKGKSKTKIVEVVAEDGTIKKVKMKLVQKASTMKEKASHLKEKASHMKQRLGNRLGAFVGRSRSRGRANKDGEKEDSDDERAPRNTGGRRGRARHRGGDEPEEATAHETKDQLSSSSSAKKEAHSLFRRRKSNDPGKAVKEELALQTATAPTTVEGGRRRSRSPNRVVKKEHASVVSPLAFFGRSKVKKSGKDGKDANESLSSIGADSEALAGGDAPVKDNAEPHTERSLTPVPVSRTTKEVKQVEKTPETTVLSTSTTTVTTTSSVTTKATNHGNAVVKTTVIKTVTAPPVAPAAPTNVIKVEESLMPEYVQTNEPIEYTFSNNKTYYTNKLERKNLDWQKPEWAQKPVLKSTPKKEGTVGPVVTVEEKQIAWEKPAWAKQNVLKPTDRGVALKQGADIALPITLANIRK